MAIKRLSTAGAKRGLNIFSAASILVMVQACTTYPGDRLLTTREHAMRSDKEEVASATRDSVSALLNILKLSQDEKLVYQNILPTSIVRDDVSLLPANVDSLIVIVRTGSSIAHASNSIIISDGTLHISHSSNNIIVCGGDVDISHDGSRGSGSLVISKGKVEISHAWNSIVYAVGGMKISHAHNVQSFNTHDLKASWGDIRNTLVEPLFKEESAPNKSPQPTGSAGG